MMMTTGLGSGVVGRATYARTGGPSALGIVVLATESSRSVEPRRSRAMVVANTPVATNTRPSTVRPSQGDSEDPAPDTHPGNPLHATRKAGRDNLGPP